MPDDHSKLVPLLPIPNRTVKRLSADDSADSCVKVGHRQAIKPELAQLIIDRLGFFFCGFRCEFPCLHNKSSVGLNDSGYRHLRG
jgi:hypothetical protein